MSWKSAFATVLLYAAAISVPAGGNTRIYVDCRVGPLGNGSRGAPFSSITAALPTAKALSATSRVTIEVEEGICDHETYPIQLDFPVELKGSRQPVVGKDGRDTGDQRADTLVTLSTPVLPDTFFEITGSDVRISALSIDGTVPLDADNSSIPPAGPTGVAATAALDFVVEQVRIVRLNQAIRAENASGRITRNYFGEVGSGAFISGGDPGPPPRLVLSDNRIVYRVNGITLAGAGAFGSAIRAVIDNNDVVTSFTNTGPSNPGALRISPMVAAAANVQGTVDVDVQHNQFGGSAKYGIILHAGQPSRRSDGGTYSGIVDARFEHNVIGDDVVIPSLITFTNARATVFPCELDPAIPKGAACPRLTGPALGPWTYWDYLGSSEFLLRHKGELDDALIDHPALHPIDGNALANRLVIDKVFPTGTFVIVP